MRLWLTLSAAVLYSAATIAADVQYAVVAFPQQSVAVSVSGQTYPLAASTQHQNLFVGTAPSGDTYQYVVDNQPESTKRVLQSGATATGNEFFNRSRTIYDVPDLPQALNPIYPPLFTGMNKSNEIATIILQANATALSDILQNPKADLDDVLVTQMAYISNQEVHVFSGAGLSTSGQSTKDFAKQSYKININKYSNDTNLLFGRTTLKLRAEETDMTMAREKLVFDLLGAAGAAASSASWIRLYINNEPFGLFLMIDDITTHFVEDVLYAGDWDYQYTGPSYKGNAMSPTEEGNLAYLGDDPTLYSADVYSLEDKGNDNTLQKNDSLGPLIGFMKTLSTIDPSLATDSEHQGDFGKLINPTHTLIHMAINFLSGSWDGFWYQASNYYLNMDMQSNLWTLITYDFDETFGCNSPDPNLMTVAYSNYARPNSSRPLVDKLLQSPYWRSQFEQILTTIVKRNYKPSVVGPRLQAWAAMLEEDIAWSRSLPGRSPGTQTSWTVQDFINNLNATVSGTTGILEYVTARSAAVCQQLQITDQDDLSPLGPYTGGRHLDSSGQIAGGAGGSTNGHSGSPGQMHTFSRVWVIISTTLCVVVTLLV